MEYGERPPPPELAGFVKCLWTLVGDASELAGPLQPVLPDGSPELVVHFGDPFERIHEGRVAERQPAILFAGQLTRFLVLRPTGRISVLGVRLHPHGAAALLDVPQHELAGSTLALDRVSRKLGRALLDLRDASGTPEAAAAALAPLLYRSSAVGRADPRVARAVYAITSRRGAVPVDAVAGDVGMTRRHLERLFKADVGLSPKRLARIARFQHALQLLDGATPPARGARAALSCGYADQAHFVREFRELAGCAPGAYLLERARLTGFFGPSLSASVVEALAPSFDHCDRVYHQGGDAEAAETTLERAEASRKPAPRDRRAVTPRGGGTPRRR